MNQRPYILFFFLLFCFVLTAQYKTRLYGYVFDTEQHPIELVTVQIHETTVGTTTDKSGYFELELSGRDSVKVNFSFLGFEPQTIAVPLKFKSQKLIVYLETKATMLDDVEVRAMRRQIGTTATLDVKKFKLMPDASGGNIESLVLSVAGVSSTNELSSQYSVRGGNYDENSVYVNDIEVYRPLLVRAGQQEGLSFINPDMVEEVSFSAGGFDAQYGDKMSSVLSIQYKKPKTFEASAGISLLGASAYIGQASKDKKFTQLHGLRYKTNAYLLGTLEAKGQYNPSFIDYQTYLTFQFAPKWEATFLGNFSQNRYNFVPDSLSSSFGTLDNPIYLNIYYDGQEKDLFRTAFGAGTITYKPNKNLSLGLLLSAFNTNEQETYDITGQYWLSSLSPSTSSSDENVIGVGTYHNHARNKLIATVLNITHRGEYATENNQLKWGIGVQSEFISDKINEWQLNDSAGYSMPYNDQVVNMYYNLYADTVITSYRGTAFIQDTYKWRTSWGLFSFNGGLRANYWSFNKEFLLSPRLSVSYLPDWEKDFSFRFATGVYYQSPFYKEMRDTVTDNLGNVKVLLNENIKAQRSLHFVLGGDYYFKVKNRPFKFTTEIYYKPADRVIPYSVDNVRIMYTGQNNAKAYTAGIDLKLFGEFVKGVDSWISLSLMDSKEDIQGDNAGYIPRPTEQRYNFSMFFQDYFPGYPDYKVQLKLVWADGLPYGPPRNEYAKSAFRAPAYRRVDIGVLRSFEKAKTKFMEEEFFKYIKAINVSFEIFNLLDIQNTNSYYWVTDVYNRQFASPNYLTGRQFNIKLSVDF